MTVTGRGMDLRDDQEQPEAERTARRRSIGKESLIVGLCALGGIILGVVAAWMASGVVATVLVDAGPGTPSDGTSSVSADVANRYVQTELVHVGILQPQFEEAMRAVGVQDPSAVEGRQVAMTSLIELSTTAPDAEQASRQANTAADIYIRDWRTRATADIERKRQNTEGLITAVLDSLSTLKDTPTDRAQAAGLRRELAALTEQRAAIENQAGQIQSSSRLVQEASPDQTTERSSSVVLVALGLILGTLAGLTLVLYRRMKSGARQQQSAL